MDDRPPLPKEVVRAFLSRPETVRWVHAHARACLPRRVCQQVAQDALVEALASPWVPSDEAALPSWLRTITDRVIADYLEKMNTRAEYEGDIPEEAVRTDEAGLPIDDPYADDIHDIDASVDPTQETMPQRSSMLRRFFAEKTAHDPEEHSTFEAICEHWDDEKPYEQIARERKVPVGTLNARVSRLQVKYGEQYKKYRNGMILTYLFRGGAVVAAIAIAVYLLLHLQRGPKIEPIAPEPPSPAPSVSYDRRLDIAEPPAPSASQLPPLPPLPPGPKGPAPRLKP